ncbi:MAG TPA: hypothetical protein VHS31_08990 [Tepidisphaeraceae bacterium]|jgi:hypothetical protein|nr:hypothetical protein [Tepidisphaeraceae bacterium]
MVNESGDNSHFALSRAERMIEVVIELLIGLGFIAFGVSLVQPAMWWLNAMSAFRNSPEDAATISSEGYRQLTAAIVAMSAGLLFLALAMWHLCIRNRRTGR